MNKEIETKMTKKEIIEEILEVLGWLLVVVGIVLGAIYMYHTFGCIYRCDY